jgi:hypothetical protein
MQVHGVSSGMLIALRLTSVQADPATARVEFIIAATHGNRRRWRTAAAQGHRPAHHVDVDAGNPRRGRNSNWRFLFRG